MLKNFAACFALVLASAVASANDDCPFGNCPSSRPAVRMPVAGGPNVARPLPVAATVRTAFSASTTRVVVGLQRRPIRTLLSRTLMGRPLLGRLQWFLHR